MTGTPVPAELLCVVSPISPSKEDCGVRVGSSGTLRCALSSVPFIFILPVSPSFIPLVRRMSLCLRDNCPSDVFNCNFYQEYATLSLSVLLPALTVTSPLWPGGRHAPIPSSVLCASLLLLPPNIPSCSSSSFFPRLLSHCHSCPLKVTLG